MFQWVMTALGVAAISIRLALFLLVAGGTVIADSFVHSANAQCPTGSQIYIDTRLVPQRQRMSHEQAMRILSVPGMPENVKNWAIESYYTQFQPIQIPFRGGTVLISPTDPCIQQYIGR